MLMKRRTFYIVAIILVCIGAISGLALTQIRSKSLNICTGDECETTIKEYAPLEASNDNVVLLEGEESGSENAELIQPAPQVIDVPSFEAGENPETINGAYYKHNGFFAGETVTLNQAGFDGILFAAGNKVKSHGAQDYLVAAGSEISIDSTTTRDLFAAAQTVDFSKNASIRDGYIAAAKVVIRGEVEGNLNIAAGEVIFDNASIKNNVNLAVDSVEFKGDTKIFGTLKYNDDASTINLDKNNIAGIKNYKSISINSDKSVASVALTMLRSFCVTAVAMSFLAIIIARFAPKRYESLQKTSAGLKDMCIGLVSMLIIPTVVFILLFVEYFSILGILGILLVVIAFILGSGVAVIRFGKIIEKSLFKNKAANEYSICLFGALAFALLSAIPVVGSTILLFAVIAGFGFMIREGYDSVKPGLQKIGKIEKASKK